MDRDHVRRHRLFADGGLTARVIWRPEGRRDATRVWETFSAGSDAQNLARADGFKRMVEAAGQRWPDGWVKGEGFVRPPDVADPMMPPPSFEEIGEEYVRQIVDLSPGQRKRYVGQLQVLASTPVRGSLVFAGPVTAIGEAQLKTWLIEWDRSLKTKANYHGLIYGVFAYAVKRGYLAANPAIGTAPKTPDGCVLAPGIGVVQQLTRLDRDPFAGRGPTTRSAVVSGPGR